MGSGQLTTSPTLCLTEDDIECREAVTLTQLLLLALPVVLLLLPPDMDIFYFFMSWARLKN